MLFNVGFSKLRKLSITSATLPVSLPSDLTHLILKCDFVTLLHVHQLLLLLNSLTYLEIRCEEAEVMQSIRHLSQLKSLKITFCRYISALKPLLQLPRLDRLSIRAVYFNVVACNDLKLLKHLKVLELEDCIIPNEAKFINSLKSLSKLRGLLLCSSIGLVIKALAELELQELTLDCPNVRSRDGQLLLAQKFRYESKCLLEGKSLEELEVYVKRKSFTFRQKQFAERLKSDEFDSK
jgi:hypothetical protein